MEKQSLTVIKRLLKTLKMEKVIFTEVSLRLNLKKLKIGVKI